MIDDAERPCYLAHAARAFFMNGGQRLYVSRVFAPLGPADPPVDFGVANMLVTVRRPEHRDLARALARRLRQRRLARREGDAQRQRRVRVAGRPADPLDRHLWGVQAKSAATGRSSRSSTRRRRRPTAPPKGNDDFAPTRSRIVSRAPTGQQTFRRGGANVAVNPGAIIQIVELTVTVRVDDASQRVDVYDRLSTDPRQPRFVGKVLQRDDPADENAIVYIDLDDWDTARRGRADRAARGAARELRLPRQRPRRRARLARRHPRRRRPIPTIATVKATGLEALGEIDDIAIVAAARRRRPTTT